VAGYSIAADFIPWERGFIEQQHAQATAAQRQRAGRAGRPGPHYSNIVVYFGWHAAKVAFSLAGGVYAHRAKQKEGFSSGEEKPSFNKNLATTSYP
jgi:hypothetical protein